jgi:hypothetical protein
VAVLVLALVLVPVLMPAEVLAAEAEISKCV